MPLLPLAVVEAVVVGGVGVGAVTVCCTVWPGPVTVRTIVVTCGGFEPPPPRDAAIAAITPAASRSTMASGIHQRRAGLAGGAAETTLRVGSTHVSPASSCSARR